MTLSTDTIRTEQLAALIERLEAASMFEHDIFAEAAQRLRKLEAVREAAERTKKECAEMEYDHTCCCWNWAMLENSQHQCGLCELREALAACGDECEHVWLHDIRQLTTKENRCTLCGKPKNG